MLSTIVNQAQRNTVQLCACIILRLSKLPISIMPGVAADNVAAGADNVLSNASILRHIIDFVGFGNWLPVAAVNSSWHKAYKATIRRSVYIQELFLSCDSSSGQYSSSRTNLYAASCTSYSAACESLSRLTMAHQYGLGFQHDDWRFQRIAGRAASIEVLVLAHEFGMPYSHQVLVGAVESDNINVLQWLHNEQSCAITSDLSYFAAASGQLDVLKYLAANRVALDKRACAAAARIGALDILQWFDEAGIKWKHRSVYIAAAECGSIEIMHWLTKSGAVYDAKVMETAAENGHLDICKHLRAQGCDCISDATFAAKTVEVLKWLHENGCHWDVDMMLLMRPDRAIRKYVIAESGVTISTLSELLNIAGVHFNSDIGKRLLEEGAEWPTVLQHYGTVWNPEMIEWARRQGCTSPAPPQPANEDWY
jgi:hypothetical protein